MPRAKGHPIKVIRLNRTQIQVDLYAGGEHYLKTVTVEAFTAFIRGEVDADSNLIPQASPVTLNDFANNSYIPFDAKPRFENPKSFDAEVDLIKAVCQSLGKKWLHEIRPKDAERCKIEWLQEGRVNNTIKKRLCCLRRMLDYSVSTGLIKQNLVPQPRGLPVRDRSTIWLKKDQIDTLLGSCSPIIAPLVEFLILTGARMGEALDFRRGDIRDGKLYVPTEKRRRPPREAMRIFETVSLGPRFASLIAKIKPHPKSGYFFCASRTDGKALSHAYANRLFQQARIAALSAAKSAGQDARIFSDLHPHDCRGTFSIHRAMVVNNFRQLQVELGHGDPKSVQSYLDRAQQFDPSESIFYTKLAPQADQTLQDFQGSTNDSSIMATEPQNPSRTPLLH